jgi:hypothetical protein
VEITVALGCPIKVWAPLGAFIAHLLSGSISPVEGLASHPPPQQARPAPEWTLTADGSNLVQRSTRLRWPHCVEGIRWNGKDCIGEPLGMELAEATCLARSLAKADGKPGGLKRLNPEP